MHPFNPFFAFIVYAIAFATAYLINSKHRVLNVNERFETIDGLRGFLAIGVFIHHASVWFNYIKIESIKIKTQ